MNNSTYGGQPGPGATTTQSFKEVLASTDLQAKLPGGILLAQGFGIVAKGRVLGKITSGPKAGKAGPYASTVLTVDPAIGATALTVADSSAFIIGDTVIVGTEAAAIAILAIPDATHITLASGLIADQANGATVKTNDGRQNALCILDNDADTTNNDAGASAWIAGIFDSTKVLGADAAAKAALKLCYFA